MADWKIETREDYERIMKDLDEAEMIADMSDDYRAWKREKSEVEVSRSQVRKIAIEKGLIGEDEDKHRHWNDEKHRPY